MSTGEPDWEEGDLGEVSSSSFSEIVSEMLSDPRRVSIWSSARIWTGEGRFAESNVGGAPRPLKIYLPRESSPGDEYARVMDCIPGIPTSDRERRCDRAIGDRVRGGGGGSGETDKVIMTSSLPTRSDIISGLDESLESEWTERMAPERRGPSMRDQLKKGERMGWRVVCLCWAHDGGGWRIKTEPWASQGESRKRVG